MRISLGFSILNFQFLKPAKAPWQVFVLQVSILQLSGKGKVFNDRERFLPAILRNGIECEEGQWELPFLMYLSLYTGLRNGNLLFVYNIDSAWGYWYDLFGYGLYGQALYQVSAEVVYGDYRLFLRSPPELLPFFFFQMTCAERFFLQKVCRPMDFSYLCEMRRYFHLLW